MTFILADIRLRAQHANFLFCKIICLAQKQAVTVSKFAIFTILRANSKQ